MRIELLGVREDLRVLVQIGNPHQHRAIMRNPPLAEVEVRRSDPAAGHIDDRAHPQRLHNCGPTEVAAPFVDLSDQFGQHVRVAPQPLERPGQR